MDFVGRIFDFGIAPEVPVDGIARITRVSQNKVRISYFASHIAPDGTTENRLVLHLDWDIEVWLACGKAHLAARDEIVRQVVSEDAVPSVVPVIVPLH